MAPCILPLRRALSALVNWPHRLAFLSQPRRPPVCIVGWVTPCNSTTCSERESSSRKTWRTSCDPGCKKTWRWEGEKMEEKEFLCRAGIGWRVSDCQAFCPAVIETVFCHYWKKLRLRRKGGGCQRCVRASSVDFSSRPSFGGGSKDGPDAGRPSKGWNETGMAFV